MKKIRRRKGRSEMMKEGKARKRKTEREWGMEERKEAKSKKARKR